MRNSSYCLLPTLLPLFNPLHLENHRPVTIRAAGDGYTRRLGPRKISAILDRKNLFSYVRPGPGTETLGRRKGRFYNEFLTILKLITEAHFPIQILVYQILVDGPLEHRDFSYSHLSSPPSPSMSR